ncbi:hypothetical protein ACFQH5_16770 [Halomonas salifodinae]|uniref:Uncharacterized protein n=1 Tax=Halomonas salifodinae TaxID=438745 RepID=A0ABW2F2B0_9GAMM
MEGNEEVGAVIGGDSLLFILFIIALLVGALLFRYGGCMWLSLRKWWPKAEYFILAFADKIPVVNSLCFFPVSSHIKALKKFGVLWLLTTSPVLLSVALSEVPDGAGNLMTKFVAKLQEGLSVSELFVYSASFLTPLIYIIYEKFQNAEDNADFSEKLREAFKVFKGYQLMSFLAAVSLAITAVGFTAVKTDFGSFRSTFLHAFLVGNSLYIYVFSLFCWYLSLLDSVGGGKGFFRRKEINQKKMQSEFSDRLRRSEG